MRNSINHFGKKDKNKIQKLLLNDAEFISQTKKAITLARNGKFIESEKIYKKLISRGKYDHLTLQN